jgi:hypothetical protein
MPRFNHPALPNWWRAADVWVPLETTVASDDATRERSLTVIARLPDDVATATGTGRLPSVARQLAAPAADSDWMPELEH